MVPSGALMSLRCGDLNTTGKRNSMLLSLPVVRELRERILTDGRIQSGLVIVDSFLNHRADTSLISGVGKWLTEHLDPFDLVVTAEASGIPIAFAVAAHKGMDFVYAKKQNRPLDTETHLMRKITSPTKGGDTWVTIRKEHLEGSKSIAVVDDFLSRGHTAEALGSMIEEGGSKVAGFGFAIEKSYVGGRRVLEKHGWSVVSGAKVRSVSNGFMVVQ